MKNIINQVYEKNCKIARQEIVTIKCLDLNKSKKNMQSIQMLETLWTSNST